MDVTIENITKKYQMRTILAIDKLFFKSGKVYAVLGPNGSGKSTLLECIAGLKIPDYGNIFYDGKKFNAVKHEIAMMTQKPYLFNNTVLENIKIGLKFRKCSGEIVEHKLAKYLSCFEMKHLLHKNAKKLSGGEAAKTALLRVAVIESKLSLIDEPTASMDIESTLRAEKLIRSMAENNRTVIIVTHDLYQARRIADEVLFLDNGQVIEQGTTDEVFSNPHHKLVKTLLNLNS